MEDQLSAIIKEKILSAQKVQLPKLTKRDVRVPEVPNKARTIIGMRRSGKTCFLHQERAKRLQSGWEPECLVYFNFEDERLAGMQSRDLSLLSAEHGRLFPEHAEKSVTWFLDEIQLVHGWETFARRLLEESSTELYLSGSSAKLLSREIASSMRGRGWEIVIHPFSFREYLRHHDYSIPEDTSKLTQRQQTAMDARFRDYLSTGGFPEAQSLNAGDRRHLLQGYVDVVLLRDIIERHKVTNATALRWMTRRLLGNSGSLFSVTKVEADLKSQGIAAGRETLYELLGHLEDAFLLMAMPIATESEKRRQVNPRKVYPVDHALTPVFDRSLKSNLGHTLEVVVHNELIRQRADVAYVRTKDGYEVDFLSRNLDGSQWLIQVCASVDQPETLARELRALEAAAAEFPADRQLILTAESRLPFPHSPDSVEIMPAWKWILASA